MKNEFRIVYNRNVIFIFRINELSLLNEKLRQQVEEKDRLVNGLQRKLSQLEQQHTEEEVESARQRRMETDSLHAALRDIAQAVINDADQSVPGEGDISAESPIMNSPFRPRSTSPGRSSSPTKRTRSISPLGRSRSPAFADATFSAVQAALNKRQLQVQELRAKLNASREQNSTLRKTMDERENDRRRLEQNIITLRDEVDDA